MLLNGIYRAQGHVWVMCQLCVAAPVGKEDENVESFTSLPREGILGVPIERRSWCGKWPCGAAFAPYRVWMGR